MSWVVIVLEVVLMGMPEGRTDPERSSKGNGIR